MRRIVMLTTVTAVVLLFSYRTSAHGDTVAGSAVVWGHPGCAHRPDLTVTVVLDGYRSEYS